jgi:hypothetical protein
MKLRSFLLLSALAIGLAACAQESAKIAIKVIDEAGAPVANAEAGATFERPYGVNEPARVETIRGQTDSNGVFVAKARTTGHVSWGARKNGYYPFLGAPLQFQRRGPLGWEPWGQTNVAVLKRIINPEPMRVGGKVRSMPVRDEPCGYDLEMDDWVAPHGRGKTSDFIFTVKAEVVDNLNFRGHLELRFPHPQDGILQVPFNRFHGSELRLPRIAPTNGYLAEWHWRVGYGSLKDETFLPPVDPSTAKTAYVFRVRTAVDEQGRIIRVHYGCIEGEIAFDPRTDRGAAYLRFSYFLNPTPNDRNLERDPGKTVDSLARK